MAQRTRKTAFAALTYQLNPGAGEIQLLPDGAFRATDGSNRPEEVAAWRIDPEIAARLLARLAAKPGQILIDYEHQTLHKEDNGQPAPAAGWFAGTAVEYRPGHGVFAMNPKWSKRATQYIGDEEYKFISPIIAYDTQTGAVTDIRMVALTNNPGIGGMAEVALTALNDFSTEEEPQVNELLKSLLAGLGLPETASEAEAKSALAALTAKTNEVAKLQEKVAALTAAKHPDPSQFVPVATMTAMQEQVAALTAEINGGKVTAAVDKAINDGKLLPAQKEWALELGKTNFAALTGYIEKTPVIAALGGTQSGGAGGGGEGTAALTATDQKILAQLGLNKDDYLANR